jgi:hypothetical protein
MATAIRLLPAPGGTRDILPGINSRSDDSLSLPSARWQVDSRYRAQYTLRYCRGDCPTARRDSRAHP